MSPSQLSQSDIGYPQSLKEHLTGESLPPLTIHGNQDLLSLPKTALFCSVKSPGSVILKTYDQASIWRDTGHCVISGFHSPIEKECLSILLRGASPIIICPARGMIKRIPSDWERHLDQGLLLILSFFPASETRVTASLAFRRNEYVAALADETWIAHATPGGKVASLNTKSK